MPGFHLYFSNRLEFLVDHIAMLMSNPGERPLAQEIVLIPRPGLERWLSLALARRLGIVANVRFLFPRVFTEEIISRLNDGRQSGYSHFSPGTETWRILDLLLANPAASENKFLNRYLSELSRAADSPGPAGAPGFPARSALKMLQLAERLAETFDKYLLFRGELIQAWEAGKSVSGEERWQAELWRALYRDCGRTSPLASRAALSRGLEKYGPDHFGLPSRIFLVQNSFLPGFYLEILLELADFIEIHFFLTNPSGHYWGDLRTPREIGHRVLSVAERNPGAQFGPQELHLESGNSLLASFGRGARHLLEKLLSTDGQIHDLFAEPAAKNMLGHLQRDIFTLSERGKNGAPQTPVAEDDFSLQIHSCHSPLREVEVLHEALLFFLEHLEGLQPRDILVLAPNIDLYHPFIEAVFSFSSPEAEKQPQNSRIPYYFASRRLFASSPVGNTFFQLLDFLDSRHEVGDLLELLDSSALQRGFDLSEEETARIRRWVMETRILWGRDAKSKEEIGLPSAYENTWQAGLDRLFLGYACYFDGESHFRGIMPLDGMEGQEAATLGKFADLLEFIFNFAAQTQGGKTLSQWSSILWELLERLKPGDGFQEAQLDRLKGEVRGLATVAKKTAFARPLDYVSLKYYLKNKISGISAGASPNGGVAFADFAFLSAVPARVIWLLGMDYASFPGQSPRLGFDLTWQKPRPGDPSRRDEERYLFLETILAAGDCLAISYVGQNPQDNSPIPPSAAVSELLDYLNQGFCRKTAAGQVAHDWLVVSHHLQPYHPAYFCPPALAPGPSGPGLISYSRRNCQAAQALLAADKQKPVFLPHPLEAPTEEVKEVDIGELVKFYRHPARYFLQRRLGIYYRDGEEILPARENFALLGLDRYLVDKTILELMLKRGKRAPAEIAPIVRAQGILPHGRLGEVEFSQRYRVVREFVSRLDKYFRAADFRTIPLESTRDGILIKGKLDRICSDYRLAFSLGKTNGKELLAAWVEHVFMNACAFRSGCAAAAPAISGELGESFGKRTILVTRDDIWEFRPLPQAEAILDDLWGIFRRGREFPAKLFGDLSHNYAAAVISGKKTPRLALAEARAAWVGDDQTRGLGDDPYYRLCFSGTDPLDENFAQSAEAVFRPMFDYLGKRDG